MTEITLCAVIFGAPCPCGSSPLPWAVLLVYGSHLLPGCFDWEHWSNQPCPQCAPPLPTTRCLHPKAPLNESRGCKSLWPATCLEEFSVCLFGCHRRFSAPSGAGRAERGRAALWAGGERLWPLRHSPATGAAWLFALSCVIPEQSSHLEQAPRAVLSLQGTSCTPSAAGRHLCLSGRAFAQPMAGRSSAEAPLPPWGIFSCHKQALSPLWCLPGLAFNMDLHFPSRLHSGQTMPLPLVETLCVQRLFSLLFQKHLTRSVHMDLVGLKCFVFSHLL